MLLCMETPFSLKKEEDLPLLIPDFAEDGMSDLLTNILHEQLNKFTLGGAACYPVNVKLLPKKLEIEGIKRSNTFNPNIMVCI